MNISPAEDLELLKNTVLKWPDTKEKLDFLAKINQLSSGKLKINNNAMNELKKLVKQQSLSHKLKFSPPLAAVFGSQFDAVVTQIKGYGGKLGSSDVFVTETGDIDNLRASAETLRKIFSFPLVIRIVPGVFWRETNEKRAWIQAVRYIFKTVTNTKLIENRRYWDYEDYCRFLGARASGGQIKFEQKGTNIVLIK